MKLGFVNLFQVEFLKHLHNKISELRKEFFHSPQRNLFRRPIFRICVLYVDEKISLERQLERGRKAREHNDKVRKSGTGKLVDERPTDFDVEVSSQIPPKDHVSNHIEL